MNRKINFCFNIGKDNLRRFLAIEERNNGDLLIMPAKPDYLRESFHPETNQDQIKHQKYSIHMSPKSDEINVCMHNLEFNNSLNEAQQIRTANYTRAIKSKKENLTPIFFCSPPDLTSEKYKLIIKKNEENLILDTINLQYNTILYGIFICKNNDKKYLTFNIGNQNFRRITFNNFTVILVWTYWHFISTHIGSQIHIATLDAEQMKKHFNIDQPMQNNGRNGLQAKSLSHDLFERLRNDIFSTHLKKNETLTKYKKLGETPFSKHPFRE